MTFELESYRLNSSLVLMPASLATPGRDGNARRFPIGRRIGWPCILSNLDQWEVETAS